MPRHSPDRLVPLMLAAGLAACSSGGPPDSTTPALPDIAARQVVTPAVPAVFATGLHFPRGMTFARNGDLYVAEAGSGGTTATTTAQCAQVVPPIGPYTNGSTGRISRVTPQGVVSTFADGFPSAQNAVGDVLGVNDVTFVNGALHALVSGGGCSHGSANVPSGIARVSSTGAWTIVADLSAYLLTHKVAAPEADDFEPDGSWYSMTPSRGTLVAVEPNHGDIVTVDPHTGAVARLIDVSATQGHIVPTIIAERRGALYFGNLGTFPVVPGTQKIFRLSRRGTLSAVADGFTTVLGLEFDRRGRLYVLETTTVAGMPTPNTGRVVRLDRQGHRDIVVQGLFFPTALRFGPDGQLYISNKGFGPPQPGEILRVSIAGANDQGHAEDDMEHDDN